MKVRVGGRGSQEWDLGVVRARGGWLDGSGGKSLGAERSSVNASTLLTINKDLKFLRTDTQTHKCAHT